MNTRIYIGTPSGPVQVERIWREEGIAESMVCLKRTTEILPISAGYDAFVKRPSGIIEREFGPFEAGAFRLDLSSSINQGKSWQLAVFAAHALAREGLLAGPDDPFERVIWLTGQIDNDLKVGGVTQVPEKIHGALGELEALANAGKHVLLFVPEENSQALASANLPPGVEGHTVASAADILSATGTPLARRAAATKSATSNTGGGRPADRQRGKRAVVGFAFLVLGAAAVAAGVILPGELIPDEPTPPAAEAVQEKAATDKTTPAADPGAQIADTSPIVAEAESEKEPAPSAEPSPAPAAAGPDISIFEISPSATGGCPAVHFGADNGVETEIKPANTGEFTSNTAKNLCAIEFRLVPTSGQPYMALTIEKISGRYVEIDPMPSALKGTLPFSAPVTWRIYLPLSVQKPFEYELHVLAAESAIAAEAYKSLKADGFTTADQSGMSTTSVRHAVLP